LALAALSNQVGLEVMATKSPDLQVLSYEGLATIEPFLPQRVHKLLEVQLDLFAREVVDPVLGADTVEEALGRLAARSDVAAAVSVGASRALLESTLKSDALHAALSGLGERFAVELRPTTLRWLGRTSALTLEGALRRAAAASRRYLLFYQRVLRHVPSATLFWWFLARPSFEQLEHLRLEAERLLLCVTVAAEQVKKGQRGPHASPATRGLVDELWRAVYRHERATLRWLVDCLQPSVTPGASTPIATKTIDDMTVFLRPNLELSEHFAELRREWHAATGHLANPNQIVAHPAYQAIIDLGWPIMPYLLEALEKGEPDYWGPALYQLSGEHPPLPAGEPTLERIGAAWLALARQRGWRIGTGDA
jgi:hypothetical protein